MIYHYYWHQYSKSYIKVTTFRLLLFCQHTETHQNKLQKIAKTLLMPTSAASQLFCIYLSLIDASKLQFILLLHI